VLCSTVVIQYFCCVVCFVNVYYSNLQAEKIGLDYMDVEALKKLNKNKKLVKKLAKKYHAFLASEAVIKQIPRLLGPGLNKAGKFSSFLRVLLDLLMFSPFYFRTCFLFVNFLSHCALFLMFFVISCVQIIELTVHPLKQALTLPFYVALLFCYIFIFMPMLL